MAQDAIEIDPYVDALNTVFLDMKQGKIPKFYDTLVDATAAVKEEAALPFSHSCVQRRVAVLDRALNTAFRVLHEDSLREGEYQKLPDAEQVVVRRKYGEIHEVFILEWRERERLQNLMKNGERALH